ncbi:MAG TPA: hypothetical protein VMO88_14135 [Acidimicrobiales bacterium]|nr:hypothetical protein [Acidimicrobiales bacterium]
MPVLRRITLRNSRWWATAVAVGAAGLAFVPASARADSGPASFAGTSDAFGVNLTVTVPGGPVTSTPVDSGGPTAQSELTSFGTSLGYAAFPDPGETVISAPTLFQGLLSTGLSGLPPISIPQPPPYPFYAQSEAGTQPSDQVGAGPYSLSTNSDDNATQSTASGGLADGLIGNVALVTSTSSVKVKSDGSVLAQATSEIQGLKVGPLAIGDVLSTASETASPDGTVTPSTNLVITGVQVGGLPVSLSGKNLNLPGPSVPLPINPTLQSILASSGLTATVVAPQQFNGEVLAPAVELTGPVNDLGAGTGPGTFRLILGGAEAAMQVGGGPPATTPTASSPAASSDSSGTGIGSSNSDATSTNQLSPSNSGATGAAAAGPTADSLSAGSRLAQPGSARSLSGRSVDLVSNPLGFDIRSLYLVFAAAALIAVVAAQLMRSLGVRGPWTSSSG